MSQKHTPVSAGNLYILICSSFHEGFIYHSNPLSLHQQTFLLRDLSVHASILMYPKQMAVVISGKITKSSCWPVFVFPKLSYTVNSWCPCCLTAVQRLLQSGLRSFFCLWVFLRCPDSSKRPRCIFVLFLWYILCLQWFNITPLQW